MMFLSECSPEISTNAIGRAHSRQTRVRESLALLFLYGTNQSWQRQREQHDRATTEQTPGRDPVTSQHSELVMETLPLHRHLSPCSKADTPIPGRK